jgi:CheY-like chemotaxis protein
MGISLAGRQINNILVVDDDPAARDSFSEIIADMGLNSECESGPLDDLKAFVDSVSERADAVFSDYRLKPRNYSVFEGDSLVAECFSHDIPAVLCTTYEAADFMLDRRLVRRIPVLLRDTNPEPDDVAAALEKCISELQGHVAPSRKSTRALVRVNDIDLDRGFFYVVVPGWDVRAKVRLDLYNVPTEIRKLVKPDKRFHAQVNTGAQSAHDLYFDEWETE